MVEMNNLIIYSTPTGEVTGKYVKIPIVSISKHTTLSDMPVTNRWLYSEFILVGTRHTVTLWGPQYIGLPTINNRFFQRGGEHITKECSKELNNTQYFGITYLSITFSLSLSALFKASISLAISFEVL